MAVALQDGLTTDEDGPKMIVERLSVRERIDGRGGYRNGGALTWQA